MWPFKTKDEKLNEAYKFANTLYEENEKLKAQIKQFQKDRVFDEFLMIQELKAEIMEKDREIETLKKILEFSERDKQEWRKHKEIFNFMVNKSEKLKERIKELEAELNVLTAEGRPDKEKESVFEKEINSDLILSKLHSFLLFSLL